MSLTIVCATKHLVVCTSSIHKGVWRSFIWHVELKQNGLHLHNFLAVVNVRRTALAWHYVSHNYPTSGCLRVDKSIGTQCEPAGPAPPHWRAPNPRCNMQQTTFCPSQVYPTAGPHLHNNLPRAHTTRPDISARARSPRGRPTTLAGPGS